MPSKDVWKGFELVHPVEGYISMIAVGRMYDVAVVVYAFIVVQTFYEFDWWWVKILGVLFSHCVHDAPVGRQYFARVFIHWKEKTQENRQNATKWKKLEKLLKTKRITTKRRNPQNKI